ncbi:hypothetical protein NCCP2222_05070 [Sporosarcina sp. NCCP-2222]|uniref:DUF1294 domain-containing protein n=1 Tax=Sporosarcina sp. NCCP-2222 TaxID=2935073 RepID=UPI002086A68F|nr:DUF1294 domain-containing protein [Sporosarcina sp. NCCP-2222]GKV54560.1 hypothetical protein NCCP2222_05070 [Sporosarcina sp. NCCP-2222]
MNELLIGWILFCSIWSCILMGYDKRQAKRKKRRIPEKTLWLFAIAGGGIGSYLGMQLFRHKTRHTSFRIGFLVLALLDITVLLYLFGIDVTGGRNIWT